MPVNTVISYPIPIYQNLPIEPQFYQPRMFFISDIALGQTTTITTTVDHDYVIGQECRLIIPPTFGTRELNNQTGFVIAIPASNQVTLDINSQGFNTFISSSATTQPQILAIGDVNTGEINTQGRINQITYINGSFINISPA